MAKYELKHDALNWFIERVKKNQFELVTTILRENGPIGGCIGSITGAHGHYDLEFVYLEDSEDECRVMCHLDYPAFETDADFSYLSIDERQQVIDLLINEVNKYEKNNSIRQQEGHWRQPSSV